MSLAEDFNYDVADEKNRKATDKLLTLLQRKHGDPEQAPAVISRRDQDQITFLKGRVAQLLALVTSQRSKIARLQSQEIGLAEYPRMKDIVDAVCEVYGVKLVHLAGPVRVKSISVPRFVACYLARTMTPMSLPEIGHRLGNRDHTTILHAVNKMERLLSCDGELREKVQNIAAMVDAKVFARKQALEVGA